MIISPRLLPGIRFCLFAVAGASAVWAQPSAELLARLDRFAPTFKGAKASIQRTIYTAVVKETVVEKGTFLIKRDSATKIRLRIEFTGNNANTLVLRDKMAEKYHPKLNEIEEYDLGKYKDIVTALFQLGFGASGRDVAKNYEIAGLHREDLAGEGTTVLELVPRAEDVRGVLTKAELWIADKSNCAIKQKFYLKGGDYQIAEFTDLVVNPYIAANAFDLPKGAKRTKVN